MENRIGRPKRDSPNFVSTGLMIKDPSFGKYHLKRTEECFEVIETAGVSKERNFGYFATFNGALNKIIQLRLHSKTGVKTMKEYLEEYNRINNEIKLNL